MKLCSRKLLDFAAGAAALAVFLLVMAAGQDASSQTARTIKIVVTFPAGGGGDVLTRVAAAQISRAHGVNFEIDNAEATKGTEAVSQAAPDGNTLLVLNNNFTINSRLQKPPYDPLTNFVPICNLATGPLLIVVDAAAPYRTLGDLLMAAREKPGQIIVTGGALSPPQIAVEMLKRAAKVDMRFMRSANANAAINALSNQSITASVQLYPNMREQLKANKVRALAITSRTRKDILSDVPTVAEAGFPGYEVEYWDAIYAPAGTPKETIAQLEDWFGSAVRTREFKATIAADTYAPVGVCGAEFVSFIRKELDEYDRIVREANIKAE